MSSGRASNYAARLGRVAGRSAEAEARQERPADEQQEHQPVTVPTRADRPPRARRARRRTGERVRITVDLDRDTHRALRLFAVEADADATEVVRLLIDRLIGDASFAESIRAELDEPT